MRLNYHRLLWRIGLVLGVLLFFSLAHRAPLDPKNATSEGMGRWIVCFGFAQWHLAKAKGLSPWWFLAATIGLLVVGVKADRSHEAGLRPPETLASTFRRFTGRGSD